MKNLQATVTLNNGSEMPWLGLGVFRVENGPEAAEAVKTAIVNGYRSIDTAAIYGNEESVGEGIRQGMKAAGISREDLFITSKLWNDDFGYTSGIQAYGTSLKKLGLEYLDLYLLHWPVDGKYKEAWKALEHLYMDGQVIAIGVSNFQIHHLEDLMEDADIKPVVNQIEYHPRLTQEKLLAFCREHGIQVESWSPLMAGEALEQPELKEISAKYGKSVAQIILRWNLQNGVVVIPKSTNEGRIVENSQVFDFELAEEDMGRISALNEDRRVGPDPDNFDF